MNSVDLISDWLGVRLREEAKSKRGVMFGPEWWDGWSRH